MKNLIKKILKRNKYKNCRCRPVNKAAEKAMLDLLNKVGYCPICLKHESKTKNNNNKNS